MPTLEESFRSLGELDALSARDSPVHRLDPRAKLLATLLFAGVTVSFPKYAVLPLLLATFAPHPAARVLPFHGIIAPELTAPAIVLPVITLVVLYLLFAAWASRL